MSNTIIQWKNESLAHEIPNTYAVFSRRELLAMLQTMDHHAQSYAMKMSDCIIVEGRANISPNGSIQLFGGKYRKP